MATDPVPARTEDDLDPEARAFLARVRAFEASGEPPHAVDPDQYAFPIGIPDFYGACDVPIEPGDVRSVDDIPVTPAPDGAQ
jgi:hypothetical protein